MPSVASDSPQEASAAAALPPDAQDISQQLQPVKGPAVWRAADYADGSWMRVLSEEEVAEVEAAVRSVQHVERIENITKDDYELPRLAPVLARIQQDVVLGKGFALLKGLPVHKWSIRESATAYWLISLHIGRPLPQNKHGHLLGHVKDHGGDPNDPKTRIYATSLAQPYHVDRAADAVGLLCLQTAKEGGFSSWSSSLAVYNEVLRRRPDLAQVLAQPFHLDRKGEVPAGKQETYQSAVFTFAHDGQLSVNYSRPFLETAPRHEGVPGWTPAQREALDLVEEVAGSDDLRLDYNLDPGDIQLIHNHTILHARTAFSDWGDATKRRHLFRIWLCPPVGRPLAPEWAEQYGRTTIGDRGGIYVPGVDPWVDLRCDR